MRMISRSTHPFGSRLLIPTALALTGVMLVASCGDSANNASSGTTASAVTTATSATSATSATVATTATTATTAPSTASDLSVGYAKASWGSNVTVTYSNGSLHYKSDGLPNHARSAEYAVPTAGVKVPDASTAVAAADPTKAQSYDYSIPLTPKKVDAPTSTSLGVIGVMISGAALFNPYEGDGATVATKSNFSVKDAAGNDVYFLDSCNGHPTPMGQYHYHGLPTCVTATVDQADGPSHILGIAFDGYPIYGDRDVNGKQLVSSELDACNGINSATPEFPNGVYHYVLLDVADSTSSIRCFSGVVDASLVSMNGMKMGPPPAKP